MRGAFGYRLLTLLERLKEGAEQLGACSVLSQSTGSASAQRAQYPLIKEYTLNYKGVHIMI